jgi:hypothetical protein
MVAVTAFEVAGELDMHISLDVIITVTTSPLARVELLNVVLLVPALTLFTCHW